VNLREKRKGSRGRWDAKDPARIVRLGTSGLCLGITRHPCDKTHALFVRQPRTVKAVKRWVGEGGKVTLGGPDADTLREAIEELRIRTAVGAATFLVKVQAHRGGKANLVKKPTSKQTRPFQAKILPRNGATGQIEQSFLHGKSLAE